jgi:hypothetical protein
MYNINGNRSKTATELLANEVTRAISYSADLADGGKHDMPLWARILLSVPAITIYYQ